MDGWGLHLVLVLICSHFLFMYRTQQVFLTNFALGKHLVHEDDLLSDQRGSLAYVSPDVISGKCMLLSSFHTQSPSLLSCAHVIVYKQAFL